MKSALATDLYQLTMMAGYHRAGLTAPSAFELFVRDMPPHRGYLVAAGLDQALEYLEQLRFTVDEIAYLRTVPGLARAGDAFFDEVLPSFRFEGDAWAVREGEAVFAGEPLLRVVAPAPQAQLVETALLAIIDFQTLIASKAARLVQSAAGRPVIEFGARRAHGLEAALHAARAAFVAGCVGTSNVEAGHRFGLPLAGTMAHSWVMSFPTELAAFRAYLDTYGPETTLLIDTYDTLDAARQIARERLRCAAVRLDSGDLGALSRDVRAILDAGGLTATRILASGDLDEDRMAALLGSGAPIDAFGVGTTLSTSRDSPSLGGIYKLVEVDRSGVATPVLKLSEGKRTHAGRKQAWRTMRDGRADGDWIGLEHEDGRDGRPLLSPVMRRGARLAASPTLTEIQAYCRASVEALPDGVRRLHDWDDYPVRWTDRLLALDREAMRASAAER